MNVKNSGKDIQYARDPETQSVYTLYPGDNKFNDDVGSRLEKFTPPVDSNEAWKQIHLNEQKSFKDAKSGPAPKAPVADTTLDELPDGRAEDAGDLDNVDL